jgi:phosphoesterase RecJ-like protein
MSTASGIFQAITNANSIVITAHRSPDGDSIGSSMALYHLLKKWQKNVTVVHPDPAPEFLHWVPSQEVIIDFENQAEKSSELLLVADLIFCLDYNEPSRVGKDMQEVLVQSKALKVMIDHHLHPADFCDFTLSETSACSTCELLFQWLKAIQKENEIDEVIGQCLYLGIMTDTGSFRFPSVSSGTHEIAAFLIEKGVKHFEVHEAVFDTNTIDRIRLKGYALSEKLVLIPGIPVAYASLSEEELNRFNYQKGDTEGLVNQILGIQGIKMAVFFAEKDGKVKISFRSKGEYVVNQLANDHFEGGGHAYASGGISFVSLDETIAKFVTNVKNYIPVA